MRKIDRLKVALKTGAFWIGFPAKPDNSNSIPNRSEIQEKARALWDKYVEAKRRCLGGEIWVEPDSPLFPRYDALYQAHLRDMRRLYKKYDPEC